MMGFKEEQYMSEKRDIELELEGMLISNCSEERFEKRKEELRAAFNAKWWSINNIKK